jgi:hypothetical protein
MSSGFTVATNEHLIRSNLYSNEITRMFQDDLFAMKFVRTITDFPDGTTLNMPRMGQAETADFSEGQAIKYSKFDTGNFTFTIDQYKYSANSMSSKFKRDSFWAAEVEAAFGPEQHRALMKAFEARVFNRANAAQTASNANLINGFPHRMVASGTNATLAFKDFIRAELALRKANVPCRNLVCIMSPETAAQVQANSAITGLLSPIPRWGAVSIDGLVSGFQFKFSVFGFDCYISNYLPTDVTETIADGGQPGPGSVSGDGQVNIFFSAEPGNTLPWIAAFRQMPTVYSEFNKDLQQMEFLTICEYGVACFRPENQVIILTDKSQGF